MQWIFTWISLHIIFLEGNVSFYSGALKIFFLWLSFLAVLWWTTWTYFFFVVTILGIHSDSWLFLSSIFFKYCFCSISLSSPFGSWVTHLLYLLTGLHMYSVFVLVISILFFSLWFNPDFLVHISFSILILFSAWLNLLVNIAIEFYHLARF